MRLSALLTLLQFPATLLVPKVNPELVCSTSSAAIELTPHSPVPLYRWLRWWLN